MSSSLYREDIGQSQTIPASILHTVRQQTQGKSTSPKKPVKLPPLSMLTSPATPGSANVWHHSSQRRRFQHLTDHTQCTCGAGRDISFLYDSKWNQKQDSEGGMSVPQSLLPEDYNIVKNTGVLGLLLHKDPYAVTLDNHEKHLTVFPSLQPSGRHEVLALKSTLQQMVDRAGHGCQLTNNLDLSGPTQMHNLIALVKKEQEVYNICFHELIRQVSVGCVERGSLLAEIRECYSNLLNRIPIQIKSLHDEVVAQRALDRKLTYELGRFRNLMSSLTGELGELKEQNEQAGEEIQETKNELSEAVSESEKNANLLVEYCDLYELQRKRLEEHIECLTREKEQWEQTTYHLAIKVVHKRQLNTVQKIQLSGQAWEKLGTHFAIIMADKDTKQLSVIQEDVRNWRRDLILFTQDLVKVEHLLRTELHGIETDMQQWLDIISSHTPSKTTPKTTKEFTTNLWHAVSKWLKSLNELSELFSGEVLLDRQENLKTLSTSMKKWSQMSLAVVQHHVVLHPLRAESDKEGVVDSHTSLDELEGDQLEDGRGHNVPVHSVEGVGELVTELNQLMGNLGDRTSGENGVAVAFVHLITPLETWETKLNMMSTSDTKHMVDSDIKRLVTQMKEWLRIIHSLSIKVSPTSTAMDDCSSISSPDISLVSQNVDKWSSLFSRAIQIEDGQVIKHVTDIFSSLIKWMTQILLYLTSDEDSDIPSTPPTPSAPPTSGTHPQETPAHGTRPQTTPLLLSDQHVTELKSLCAQLCGTLSEFTKEIFTKCQLVFEDSIVNATSSNVRLETDGEKEELQIFSDEATNWIRLSGVLMETCIQQHRHKMDEEEKRREEEERVLEEEGSSDGTDTSDELVDGFTVSYSPGHKQELLRTVMTIDIDDDVTEVANEYKPENISKSRPSLKELGLVTEEELPEGRGALLKDAEKLLLDLNETKSKLAEYETQSQKERVRAETAETQLNHTQEELASTKETLQQLQSQLDELQSVNNKNRKSSKGSKPKDKRKQ